MIKMGKKEEKNVC